MYQRILVALENSPADQTILGHVRELARLTGGELLLVHVADGFAARHFDDLKLRESEEMRSDRAYLQAVTASLQEDGFAAAAELRMGDPASELLAAAERWKADLIAMSTHGHRFVSDILRGTTVDRVRHDARVPVLLLKARQA